MLYYQSMHKNFEDKERKKHISNLIRFFHFFLIFTFWSSHTISIILYSNKHFFVKTFFFFFWSFSTWYIFFISNFLFQTCQFFFANFQSPKNIIFLKKTNKTLVFSIFSSFIQNKTPSYFKKEIEWETIFFCIFQKLKTHFLFWQESIFRILTTL